MDALGYATGSNPRTGYSTLRPLRALGFVWLPAGVLAMAVTLRGCWQYNSIAGTDLTRTHIAGVVASVHLGPFLGPLQSSSGFHEDFYRALVPIPVATLIAGWLPFVVVRRPVRWGWAVIAWTLCAAAAAVWYGAALLSLAFWLS